jgi:hypothetical protein
MCLCFAGTGIQAGLVKKKDYWIMHVSYGLKQQGFEFELKGGRLLFFCNTMNPVLA